MDDAADKRADSSAGTRRIRTPTSWGLISALLALLLLLLIYSDWLWRWDHLLYDSQLGLWSRPAPDDIVIVAIDNPSLARLGRWPWPRARHAELVGRLTTGGARAIVLDILFAEPNPQAPADDVELTRQLAQSGRVILPVVFEQNAPGQPLQETLPLPALAETAAALGHVHIDLDQDGIARRIYLREGVGAPRWPHMGLALLQQLQPGHWQRLPGGRNPRNDAYIEGLIVRDHEILLPFAGPPGHFRRIAYHRVLDGDYPSDLFRDKLVLVGAIATGLGDTLPTPVSGWNQPMAGVEINANLIDALRNGITIRALTPVWQAVVGLLLLLLPFLLYPRLKPRYVLLTGILLMILTLALSAVLLHGFHIWLPPTATLVVLLLGYPIWSLLRLEHTVRYFEQELARLRTEPKALPFYRDSPTEMRGLSFLQQVVPFGPWALRDSDGSLLGGDASVGKEHHPERLTLPDGRTRLELAPVESVTQGALSMQVRSLLGEYLGQFALAENPEPRNTTELIERQIGEVQLAIEELRAMRSLISDTLRQMVDGVLVVNSGGQVVLANRQAASLLGQDQDAILDDKPVLQLVNSLELNGWRWPQAFHEVLIARKTLAIEGRMGSRELLVQISSLAVSRSNQHGMILILSDISRLKQSERKRAQALNFLSHDLRSPITSLLSLAQLKNDSGEPLNREQMAERVEHYARKALRMAESFLQLARAENSDGATFHESDFVAIAHNALDEVYAEAQSRDVRLLRQLEIEEAWLPADAGLLERALINLLENAVRYSPAGSSVRLHLVADDGALVCTVQDWGPGIPKENLERIFEPFQRLQRTQGIYRGGTGLGLAFVRVVAEKHGGNIEVESEPDRGSLFRLRLPFSTTAATQV
jgi:CHASE2 domain-containing sensor protein/signal transduction histidine kinase